MAKKSAEPFRTKVRVKGVASEGSEVQGAGAVAQPRSLMEALKEASPQPASARPETTEPAASRQARELIGTEPPRRPKASRPARSKAGRLAATKLRQLERLREATAGLESLASGEIEEATVEIIRHDGRRSARGPGHGPVPEKST